MVVRRKLTTHTVQCDAATATSFCANAKFFQGHNYLFNIERTRHKELVFASYSIQSSDFGNATCTRCMGNLVKDYQDREPGLEWGMTRIESPDYYMIQQLYDTA